MSKPRKHRRRAPRGSSKSGRPRQAGDRYPSGRLKPAPPNEIVIQRRRDIIDGGDITKASDPLNFILERGWITEDQHRAGIAYLRAYAGARLGAPRGGIATLPETMTGSDAPDLTWAEMPDEDVTRIFDAAMEGPKLPAPDSAAEAMKLWKELNGLLDPAQRKHVFDVCVLDSWPQWVIQRVNGHYGTKWEQSREHLLQGLDRIAVKVGPKPKRQSAAAPVQLRS